MNAKRDRGRVGGPAVRGEGLGVYWLRGWVGEDGEAAWVWGGGVGRIQATRAVMCLEAVMCLGGELLELRSCTTDSPLDCTACSPTFLARVAHLRPDSIRQEFSCSVSYPTLLNKAPP